MSLFKRKGNDDAAAGGTGEREDVEAADPAGAATGAEQSPDDGPADAFDRAADGPFDVSEVEVEGAAGRVDLGAVWVPGRQGMELRLELEEKTQRVIAATVALAGSSLQLQAFAAPRRDGLWDGIRTDIAATVTKQGGTAEEVPGRFGRELLARIPVRTSDGRSAHQATRFVGVDGPRWFLRGVFNGPAAYQPEQAAALEEVLRGVVVVRGSEAMAPRELLALKLPKAQPSANAGQSAAGQNAEAPEPAVSEPPARP